MLLVPAIQMGRPSKIRAQPHPLLSSQSSANSQNNTSVENSPTTMDPLDVTTKVEDDVLDQLPAASLPDVDFPDDPFSFISDKLADKKISIFTPVVSCSNGLSFNGSPLDMSGSCANCVPNDCNGLSGHVTSSSPLGQPLLNIVPDLGGQKPKSEDDKQLANVASFVSTILLLFMVLVLHYVAC
jgi:hypothetical protein